MKRGDCWIFKKLFTAAVQKRTRVMGCDKRAPRPPHTHPPTALESRGGDAISAQS